MCCTCLLTSPDFTHKISVVSADFVVIIQACVTLCTSFLVIDRKLHRVRIVAVNRLVLSLSYSANAREDSEYRSRSGFEPPLFAANSVLGNIGGLVHSLPDSFDGLEETSGSQKANNGDDRNFEAQDAVVESSSVREEEGFSNNVTSHLTPNGITEKTDV